MILCINLTTFFILKTQKHITQWNLEHSSIPVLFQICFILIFQCFFQSFAHRKSLHMGYRIFAYLFNGCAEYIMFVASFRVRFHYGHPDVFDRLFHLTRGGVSKASKVINLSEDIFAGILIALKLLQAFCFRLTMYQFHISVLYRFQFYLTWWQGHSSWIYTSW